METISLHHLEEVGCVAFSPDGKYVAAGSRGVSRLAGDFWKGEVIVWELATKKKIGSVRLPVWAQSLAFSSDKFHLAVGGGVNWNGAPDFLGFVQTPGQVFLFEFPSLKEKKRVSQGTAVLSVKFSPDDQTLASSSITSVEVAKRYVPGEVILWNVPGLSKKLQLKSVDNWDAPIAFSPKGEMLAVGEGFPRGKGIPKGVVKLVDSESGGKIREISVGNESVKYLEFSPDGKMIAVLKYGGEAVGLWEVQTGKEVTPATFAKDFGDNKHVAFSPNGSFLAAVGSRAGNSPGGDSWVLIWDLGANEIKAKWDWPEEGVLLSCLAFSPDSSLLAIGTNKGEIRILSLAEE